MRAVSFDQWVLDSAVSQRTAWLVDVVDVVTDSGGTLASWLVASVLTIVLLIRGLRIDALLVAGSMLSGLLVMSGLKRIVARARPPLPERLIAIDSYSMPSGHAMMTAILATAVAAVVLRLALPRTARVLMVALLGLYTFAVGLSRVYLGAHWMTDVLAGWCCGIAWAALWIVVLARVRRRTRH